MRGKLPFLIQFFMFLAIYNNSFAQSDTSIFTYKEYIENIIKYHPIAKKANLKVKLGDAELLSAKGNFDPTISSELSEKFFNGKQYYRIYQTKLNIPTPIGLDVVGGYENTSGVYLNPENTTGENGLWKVGAELDVLQNLIVDERRTTKKQAAVFKESTKNEQQILLNEIIFDATSAYLQWQLYYNFSIVLDENEELAKLYFDNSLQSFKGGEKTAMDTLEAFILYQDAILTAQKYEMELIKSRLIVANYLWYEDSPVELRQTTIPGDFNNSFFTQFASWSDTNKLENNPMILAPIYKLSMLEIEQKLKREKLKPKLKLKYYPLLATSSTSFEPIYSVDNYSWGFYFSMPLFLRSERANIQKGEIKIAEAELDIKNKRNELLNKIENSWQQQALISNQLNLLNSNMQNYKLLLDGEYDKFKYGESSIFILNKRQEKYFSSKLKLIEMQVKQQTEKLKFLYYTNQLLEN